MTETSTENKFKKSRKKHKKSLKREIAEWTISIIIAVVLALIVHNYIFQIVKVYGPSMEPTLYTDERMAVTKFTYLVGHPQRGDIVVTKFPEDNLNYVKRVIALGGETLEIKDSKVYVNNKVLNEPYIKGTILSDFKKTTVPEGKYMVLGDNRNNSRDSRSISVGALDENLIVGKVQYIIWPFKEFREVNHYTGTFD